MSGQDRQQLRERFEKLKQLQAQYDNKRAALIGKLDEKRKQKLQAENELKELGIDPEHAEAQIAALRDTIVKQITDYKARLEVEIEKLTQRDS